MTPIRGAAFELARVTLEFDTPVRVGSGGWDPLVDAFFATDANGLPALPGTSIAGVLRHASAGVWANRTVEALFGLQNGEDGAASLLEVSWGQVHDQHDRPVPFRGADHDAVLSFLAAGVVRDHVRIGRRGVVDERGKFDEKMVPAGARFTFELVLHDGAPMNLAALIGLLGSPQVRLGGGSRNGLGRFRILRVDGARFDLRDAPSRAAFAHLPRGLHAPVPEGVLQRWKVPAPPASERFQTGVLVLEPLDYWLIGAGDAWREEHHRRSGKGTEATPAKIVPVEQRRVRWEGGRGVVADAEPAVPATAIKGPLRHRAEFHARRRAGRWREEDASAADTACLMDDLFGAIRDGEAGHPGRLLLADGRASGFQWGWLDHVSLDRFTQGPLDHHLFSEAPLFGGRIEVPIALDLEELAAEQRQALDDALQDLCDGRLAIGAGRSRGHGFCRGRIQWDDETKGKRP